MKNILSFVLLLAASLTGFAQSVPGPFNGNSFTDLNDRRTKLNIQIPELENRIVSFSYSVRDEESVLRDIRYNEYYVSDLRRRLDTLPKNDPGISGIQKQIDNLEFDKARLQKELARSNESAEKKIAMQKSLDSLKAERNDVEYKINLLMIPKISQQNFMFWASLAFVLLMCILLYTFYIVVKGDMKVRTLIFGSDSGIQFVTLFSIVIAIILFGLTGVLEGKELAALLGSVAGYILGKANFKNEQEEVAVEIPAEPAPLENQETAQS